MCMGGAFVRRDKVDTCRRVAWEASTFLVVQLDLTASSGHGCRCGFSCIQITLVSCFSCSHEIHRGVEGAKNSSHTSKHRALQQGAVFGQAVVATTNMGPEGVTVVVGKCSATNNDGVQDAVVRH
ncbi:hypothetical protein TRVL_00476 [Trypanosoma vivax]|nr:hypothetical protein TRVL_00476 [Trypanosoma vivax]